MVQSGCYQRHRNKRGVLGSRPGALQEMISQAKTLVVKVGTSLVTHAGRGLDVEAIARWAAQIARLRQMGRRTILVSSGAIAEGMQRLGWTRPPHSMHEPQAATAGWAIGPLQCYESFLRQHSPHTGQVRLTHADIGDRQRELNHRTNLRTQ